MDRRDMMLAAAAGAAAILATPAKADAQFSSADPRQYVVHSGCSGWIITRNSATDYSLRMVAEDGNSSIKFIRLTGPDAFQQLQDIYQMMTLLTGLLGVTKIS